MAIGEVKTLVFADGITVAAPTPSPASRVITDSSNWTSSTKTITYDVSSIVGTSDAADWTWFFKDSTKTLEGADCTPTDATHVQVNCGVAPGAGTYYLWGIY